jgi:hypothetical protein
MQVMAGRDQMMHPKLAHVAERHRRNGFVALLGHDRMYRLLFQMRDKGTASFVRVLGFFFGSQAGFVDNFVSSTRRRFELLPERRIFDVVTGYFLVEMQNMFAVQAKSG